ncbi:MAG: hypothetical protein WBA67_11180 [Jannaschia sp.]
MKPDKADLTKRNASNGGPEGASAAGASRQGFLAADGRIDLLSARLTQDLGLDAPEDLRGLPFSSLWAHADRAAIARAFGLARRGSTGLAVAGLAYLSGQATLAHVTFAPAREGQTIIMTIDWPDGEDMKD